MKDYHYECMIIILSHLAAETGDLINQLKDRESCTENSLCEYVDNKLNELIDILEEVGDVWDTNKK